MQTIIVRVLLDMTFWPALVPLQTTKISWYDLVWLGWTLRGLARQGLAR